MDPWLTSRLNAAPPALRERMTEALAGGPPRNASLPQWLKAVAERLLDDAKTGPATRATALTLLAADALATYVCEWTAEFEPRELGEIR